LKPQLPGNVRSHVGMRNNIYLTGRARSLNAIRLVVEIQWWIEDFLLAVHVSRRQAI